MLARLAGHSDAVFAVAFSPDGKYVATASFDSTLKLWDAGTGKEIKTYGGTGGHTKQVISLAFSQDGSMLASGSTDNTIKVWDVPVNLPIRSLKTNDAVTAVALSPDGTKLAHRRQRWIAAPRHGGGIQGACQVRIRASWRDHRPGVHGQRPDARLSRGRSYAALLELAHRPTHRRGRRPFDRRQRGRGQSERTGCLHRGRRRLLEVLVAARSRFQDTPWPRRLDPSNAQCRPTTHPITLAATTRPSGNSPSPAPRRRAR